MPSSSGRSASLATRRRSPVVSQHALNELRDLLVGAGYARTHVITAYRAAEVLGIPEQKRELPVVEIATTSFDRLETLYVPPQEDAR